MEIEKRRPEICRYGDKCNMADQGYCQYQHYKNTPLYGKKKRSSVCVPVREPQDAPAPEPEPEPAREDKKECAVCMNDLPKPTHVLDPCGHMNLCGTCVSLVKTCPTCRKTVVKAIRVFA